jgi:hypothetical protein
MNIHRDLYVLGFFVLLLVFFVSRYLRYGSITGFLLGGRIDQTIGEVIVSSSGMSSQVLKVGLMQSPGKGSVVALSFVSKAVLGASLAPIALTKEQARSLSELLAQAAIRSS